MIYLPKRAVFIHIPRTGGNSITNAIASTCAGNNIDCIIGTAPMDLAGWYKLNRHIRAANLYRFISEWDDIFKFAIFRPEQERIDSVSRLIDRDIKSKVYEESTCPPIWREVLLGNKEKYLAEFALRDWDWHVKDQRNKNGDLGVERFEFKDLSKVWSKICEKCQIPQCKLPHLNIGSS